MTHEQDWDKPEDQEEVQSDVISERMAKVIDETEEAAQAQPVTPHWEVVDAESGDPTIYHLHDGNQVPASLTARDNGERIAKCSQCGTEIELGGQVREPATTRSS
jgi:hypothetical protein